MNGLLCVVVVMTHVPSLCFVKTIAAAGLTDRSQIMSLWYLAKSWGSLALTCLWGLEIPRLTLDATLTALEANDAAA